MFRAGKTRDKRPKYKCPVCKCSNLIVLEEDVDGFMGSKKYKCPECGQITVKL